MFLRASAFAIGATESSRSRKTWSELRPWAFSRNRGLEPGTAWQERRARSCRVGCAETADGDDAADGVDTEGTSSSTGQASGSVSPGFSGQGPPHPVAFVSVD